MGRASEPPVKRRAAPHPDPVPIARAVLCEHVADLDEAYEVLGDSADPRVRQLLGGVLGSLQSEVFGHLPAA